MKTLVFGSLNLDKTYELDEFVQPGQTICARNMTEYCGGKGFNQAVALSRAGNHVYFAGAVGVDGQRILDALDQNKIDRHHVRQRLCATGHAIIQVDRNGQNCIIILSGANDTITQSDVIDVLDNFGAGDLLVLQNEISNVDKIVEHAHEKGMVVAYNPSPFNEKCLLCDLDLVNILLINETEGRAMTNLETAEDILRNLHAKYPRLTAVLTLGHKGSMYIDKSGEVIQCGIYSTQVVDTTAAGDTFTGYFLSSLLKKGSPREALRQAAIAVGLSVSRHGAEPSIPFFAQVIECEKMQMK